MMSCLLQSIFVARNFSLQTYQKCFYRSMTKLADTLATTEERKCMPLNSNDILSKKDSILII